MTRHLSLLALLALAVCAVESRSQVVAPRGQFESFRRPSPPLLSVLELETPGDDAIRERNKAATSRDYYALRSYHYQMRVYVGELRRAERYAEAEHARAQIETYKGFLTRTRARLREYGEGPRRGGLSSLLPLRPPLLRVARSANPTPEEEARYRAAAISNAQRNIQHLTQYQEDLDDFLTVEDDELEPERRAEVDAASAENRSRLAEERALLHELGGDATPPPAKAEPIGGKAREALEKAGGTPAKDASTGP